MTAATIHQLNTRSTEVTNHGDLLSQLNHRHPERQRQCMNRTWKTQQNENLDECIALQRKSTLASINCLAKNLPFPLSYVTSVPLSNIHQTWGVVKEACWTNWIKVISIIDLLPILCLCLRCSVIWSLIIASTVIEMLSRKQGYQHVWSQIEKWKPEVSELGGQLLYQLLSLVQLRQGG